MNDRKWLRRIGRSSMLVGAALLAAVAVPAWQSQASPAEWNSHSQQKPQLNTRIARQPRPLSAPSGYNGHAVTLTGTVEFMQPRPASAPVPGQW